MKSRGGEDLNGKYRDTITCLGSMFPILDTESEIGGE